MHDNCKRLIDFLEGLGTASVAHSRNNFLTHLVGVCDYMEEHGCTQELCEAGLFHSIYGTELFQGFKLPLERRPEVRALIGERAEHLAYLNCAMDRASFDRAVEQGTEPYRFRDRLTGEEVVLSAADFDDLGRIHLYDWLEQVPRSQRGWDYRRAAYRRLAGRLGGVAVEAYERVFADAPAAV